MKNHELYAIVQNADKLKSLSGYPFVFELNRNIKIVKDALNELELIREETSEYKEFKEKYLKLRESYADVDKDGKPVTVPIPNTNGMMTYQVTKKEKEFAVEEKKLETKYRKVLDIQESKWKDFNAAMEDDVKVSFYTVSEENIPKNVTLEQLQLLDFMITKKEERKSSNAKRAKNK